MPEFAYTVVTDGVDPGAIGAGKIWQDISSEPPTVQVRNQGDTGWDAVGGVGTAWGEANTAMFSSDGNPTGVVTPNGVGDICVDTGTPALWQATGTSSADWEEIGAGGLTTWGLFGDAVKHGEGSPIGEVSPDSAGEVYLSDTPAQLWQANGTGPNDWQQISAFGPNFENVTGSQVTIANADNGNLTWDNVSQGAVLLDRTVPDTPTFITAGIYSVTVYTQIAGTPTPGGSYRAFLIVDPDGLDMTVEATAPTPQASGDANPQVALSVVAYFAAGAAIQVQIHNYDGVQSNDYSLGQAIIQQVG